MTLNRHQFATLSFAVALSLACLLRGAVYDSMIALLLLAFAALLVLMRSRPLLHDPTEDEEGDAQSDSPLQRIEPVRHTRFLLALFALLPLVQLLLAAFGVPSLKQHPPSANTSLPDVLHLSDAALDSSGWISAYGHVLLLLLGSLLAIEIGQDKRLSRLFLKSLAISGLIAVLLTFVASASYHYHPSRPFSHGLVNANHAATYLGILLCLSIWKLHLLVRRLKPTRKHSLIAWFERLSLIIVGRIALLIFALMLYTAAIFLTQSRGGIPIAVAAALLLIFTIVIKRGVRIQKPRVWLSGLILCMVTLTTIVLLFDMFGKAFVLELAQNGHLFPVRPWVYASSFTMLSDYALTGIGLGSFEAVFPQYRLDGLARDGLIQHSYNSLLQIAVEQGIIGLLATLYACFATGVLLMKNLMLRHKHYGFAALGVAVWSLLMLHSLIDFPMQIPAIGVMGLSIILICCCQSTRRGNAIPRSRPHIATD